MKLISTSLSLPAAFFARVGSIWSPAVTFGQEFWSTAWCAVCGALVILSFFVYRLYVELNHLLGVKAVELGLSLRLHRRAVAIALGSFMEGAEYAARTGIVPPCNDLHVTLHSVLVRIFRNRMDTHYGIFRRMFAAFTSASVVINFVLYTAMGCMPAWVLGVLALLCIGMATTLVNFSVSNHGLEVISALYLEARDELLALLTQPGIQKDPYVSYLRSQAELLLSLAENDRYKGRFMGFAIGFGVLRTLAASLFTLGIGVWSIMRGAGIYATLESYCLAK